MAAAFSDNRFTVNAAGARVPSTSLLRTTLPRLIAWILAAAACSSTVAFAAVACLTAWVFAAAACSPVPLAEEAAVDSDADAAADATTTVAAWGGVAAYLLRLDRFMHANDNSKMPGRWA